MVTVALEVSSGLLVGDVETMMAEEEEGGMDVDDYEVCDGAVGMSNNTAGHPFSKYHKQQRLLAQSEIV